MKNIYSDMFPSIDFFYNDKIIKNLSNGNTSHVYKAIDLFCGIGGFRLAMNNLKIKTVLSSDIDKFARATYHANFEEYPLGNIYDIDLNNIPDFDLLTAGFPCQPFSYAGRNEGFKDKTKGTLFFKILDFIELKKPKMFLLENVKGLKSHDKGKTLAIILNALKDLNYDIHWEIINSLDFGLPQKRERWYCVGFDRKINFKFPKGNNSKNTLKDIVEENDAQNLKLTPFEMERIRFHFQNAHKTERVKHDNSKYKPTTKKGKHGIYSYQKPDKSLRFHVGDVAKTQIQEAFYCCLDTYAPTIIANRVPKLWDIGRKLSVLEAKRLQGFPDDFHFPVSDNQAYKQLGNSIAIPVVQAILKSMINQYRNENIQK